MRRVGVAVALLLAVTAPAVGAGADDAPSEANTAGDAGAHIESVYPNPVAEGDDGEFVVLSVPPDTELGRYAIADDESKSELPAGTASGRVAVSTAPNRTENLVDIPVRTLTGLELSNDGEPLRLVRNGTTIDTLAYGDAPEGSLRTRNGSTEWRPLGATDRPVVTGGAGTVRAFVLPDAPGVPLDHLQGADQRLLLAGYTLTSERVADALIAAQRRNVTVRVLVDGNPVGGLSRREARLLSRLDDAGVDVRAVGGEYARYEFHHAKYAVADGAALVTTENWKPAGTGGAASRGWGVVTGQRRLVSALVETFEADIEWRGALSWERFRDGVSPVDSNASTASYPRQFDPANVTVDRTRLLVAPDNAERALLDIIDNASTSVAVEQVSIGGRHSPFLQATLDAARRGVDIRVLLSGAWYTREENGRLVDWLNERASEENLPLTARVAEPGGSFEKIHAKGVVVDGETVVLGSMNWNNNSARDNREVAVVLEGDEAGAYFERVFEADWPSRSMLPFGYLLVLGCVAAAVVVVVRRLRFEESADGIAASDGERLTQD